MPKKILISVTNDIAYDQRMQKSATTLVNAGYEVKIIGRMKKSNSAYHPDLFSIYRFNLLFSKGKFFYLEYNVRLFVYLLFERFDILCAVDLDTILPNVLVGKLKGKPIVYDAHEYFTEVPELHNRKLEKSIWKWIERCCIPHCDKMYTVSQGIADLFEAEYKKPCEVIYNFPRKVENKQPKTNTSQTNKILIYQGDLNEGRGLDIAIEGLKSFRNLDLWIVGDGYERTKLELFANEHGVEDRVKFYGYIKPIDLPQLTSQADFGLNLLENKGLNHYYSLANKQFDYIQAGIPPISMNFPEYKYFNDLYPCAILLDYLTVETFVNELTKVINDENSYSVLQKNCDIAAPNLNWEAQEIKLSSIYHNV
jgi:glycosyltransferase involved in cell wall biosynthesis